MSDYFIFQLLGDQICDLYDDDLLLTQGNKQFLLFDEEFRNNRLICYASNSLLTILSESKRWHTDWFKCNVSGFQLYIIYAWKDVLHFGRQMYPCAYIFFKRKDEHAYEQMLNSLIDRSSARGFELKPDAIMSDFDAPFFIAAKKVFPHTRLIGCWFHFKTLCNVANDLMKTKFESKEEIKSWMFLFGGIPFVEPARVQEAFDLILALKPDTDETLTSKQVEKLDKFVNNFEKTWIKPASDDAIVYASIFNQFDNDGPRTNIAKQQNRSLKERINNRACSNGNPSFYEMVQVIRSAESYWYFNRQKRSKSSVHKDSQMSIFRDQYKLDHDLERLLRSIADLYSKKKINEL